MSNADTIEYSSAGMPKSARLVLASTLITNIGNGMHTLTMGKLLYDYTGSAAAFGSVIVTEYVVTFLLQLLAGSVVDRGSPKRICVGADLIRAAFICIASLQLDSDHMYWWLLASVLIINMAKPFYRSATFAIGPAIVPPALLTRYNALNSSFLQIGQLLGAALAGPVIQYLGANVSFGLNGLSYVLAGLAIWLAPIMHVERKHDERTSFWASKFLDDWQEIVRLLRSNLTLVCHLLLTAGDYVAVSLVNLMLVPLVEAWYGGNAFWLSALDGAFACGAIIAASVTPWAVRKLGVRNIAWAGMTGQGLLFAVLSTLHSPLPATAVMAGLGTLNTFSVVIFSSNLQRRSYGPIKGRIAAVRNLSTAILAGSIIPIVSSFQVISLELALLSAALICAMFGILTLILSRNYVFGDMLLGAEAPLS